MRTICAALVGLLVTARYASAGRSPGAIPPSSPGPRGRRAGPWPALPARRDGTGWVPPRHYPRGFGLTNGVTTHTGPAQCQFGALTNSGIGVYWDDIEVPPPWDDHFRAALTIRDASGESGVFEVFGTGSVLSDPMLFSFTVNL